MANRDDLTAEYVRQIFDYNPEIGELRWKLRTDLRPCDSARLVGRLAGSVKSDCVNIKINGKMYKAHRVIFLWMKGEWPKYQCDHVDVETSNNRWSNLREATQSQNQANKRLYKNNSSGLKGVHWRSDVGKYQAQINKSGKRTHLGYFDDPNDGHAAFCRASQEEYGKFARTK